MRDVFQTFASFDQMLFFYASACFIAFFLGWFVGYQIGRKEGRLKGGYMVLSMVKEARDEITKMSKKP